MQRYAQSFGTMATLAAMFVACSSSSSPSAAPPPTGGNDAGGGSDAAGTDAGGGDSGPAGPDGGTGAVTFKVVDCNANESDPKCQPPSSSNRGTIGSGAPFYTGGLSDDIRGGFVSGTTLVLAVEYGAQDDDLGGIVSVDLTNGNRTLVSGKRSDTESRGDGSPKLNNVQIPDLGGVWDVEPLPGGHYVALVSKGVSGRRTLVEIDPATGNRTLIWASDFADSVDQKNVETMVAEANLCDNPGGAYVDPSESALAVDSSGNIYLAGDNNPLGSGRGLLKLTKAGAGYTCAWASVYGGASPPKGSGASPVTGYTTTLAFAGSKVWAVQSDGDPRLVTYDLATGDRAKASDGSKGNPVGTGPAVGEWGLAIDGNSAYTTKAFGQDNFYLSTIDLTNGNRTGVGSADLSKGSLALASVSDASPGVWKVPGNTILVVDWNDGLHLFDPATKMSNLFSY